MINEEQRDTLKGLRLCKIAVTDYKSIVLAFIQIGKYKTLSYPKRRCARSTVLFINVTFPASFFFYRFSRILNSFVTLRFTLVESDRKAIVSARSHSRTDSSEKTTTTYFLRSNYHRLSAYRFDRIFFDLHDPKNKRSYRKEIIVIIPSLKDMLHCIHVI